MDIPEYTFKEIGYSGSLQDIANILEYPQEQVLFSENIGNICKTTHTSDLIILHSVSIKKSTYETQKIDRNQFKKFINSNAYFK